MPLKDIFNPVQLVLSGVLFVLLFVVFVFGVRRRNHPVISLHCIALSFILSLAFSFLGQLIIQAFPLFFGWGLRSAGYGLPRGAALISALAAAQTLLGLLLTAVLILLRTRQTSPAQE